AAGMSTRRHEGNPHSGRDGAANAEAGANTSPAFLPPLHALSRAASRLTVEIVEAPRAIPLLSAGDYRVIDAYIIHYHQFTNEVEHDGWLARLSRAMRAREGQGTRRATVAVTEIISAARRQRYEDGELVAETVNSLGRLP